MQTEDTIMSDSEAPSSNSEGWKHTRRPTGV
jgi:hypothetical protein